MDTLSINFFCGEYRGWSKARFILDNDIYHDYHFSKQEETVQVSLDLLDGKHTLQIEFYGKTEANVLFSEAENKIVQEQFLELRNIYVNNVEVPEFITYSGVYAFNDQQHKSATWFGVNGTWTLEFQTPIIDWLLNEKILIEEKYNPPVITFSQKVNIEKEKLKKIKDILSKL
jgi:hypothetical protein